MTIKENFIKLRTTNPKIYWAIVIILGTVILALLALIITAIVRAFSSPSAPLGDGKTMAMRIIAEPTVKTPKFLTADENGNLSAFDLDAHLDKSELSSKSLKTTDSIDAGGNTTIGGTATIKGNTTIGGEASTNGNITLNSPGSGIHRLNFVRKDEDGKLHEWSIWHMNKDYRKNGLEIWEYPTGGQTLSIESITGNLTSKGKIIGKELCIGSTCLTEDDLKNIKNNFINKNNRYHIQGRKGLLSGVGERVNSGDSDRDITINNGYKGGHGNWQDQWIFIPV